MATARLHALRTFAGMGIAFSLYFSVIEIWKMISEKIVYGTLIMPTCFYGLIIYVWVFVLAMKVKTSKIDTSHQAEGNVSDNNLEETDNTDDNPHIA